MKNSDLKLSVKLFAIRAQFQQFLNCEQSQIASIKNQTDLSFPDVIHTIFSQW